MAPERESGRKRHLKRLESLKQEQSSWRSHWADIRDYIQPWLGRFVPGNQNQGGKKDSKILNSAPRRASRILASGMMAGMTSPARPWFRLTTPDPTLAESGAVKAWLFIVEQRLRDALAKSNIYGCLHSVYAHLGSYGTAALHIEEDLEDGIRGYVFPIGQFFVAASARQQIDTIYREFSMTVGQLVDKFGIENCCPRTQEWHRGGHLDRWLDVVHAIVPDGKGKWASCWMEKATGGADDSKVGFLRESFFHEFPVMCPRWDVAGEDIYGHSPGMDALADAKGLQQLESRRLDLVDLAARPPLKGDPEIRRASLVPGDFTPVRMKQGSQTLEPILTVQADAIAKVKDAIDDHERRIYSTLYADIFQSLLDRDGPQMTAREVQEIAEEKLVQLGPVLERSGDELLDPMIDRIFGIELRAGRIPRPPEELQGVALRVEYISILAQAQKARNTTGIERVAEFAVQYAANTKTAEALDKINVDKMVDALADAVGLSPSLINDNETVAKIRKARADQMAAQQHAAGIAEAASAAKDASAAKLDDDNALTRLLEGMGAAA